MPSPIRPQRWVDRYPQERSKLDMDDSTLTGIIFGLVLFILLLAVSNYLRTGSIVG